MSNYPPELTIIVGEEVYSQAGEIIGLFLQERIPSGLTALETARRIKAQGGLVLPPHSFDSLKRSHLRSYARKEIKDLVDVVEVFNGHISYQRFNTRAQAWAADNNKRMSAGSDAHTAEHVGTAYVEVLDKAIIKGVWRHPVKTLVSRLKHSQSKTQ